MSEVLSQSQIDSLLDSLQDESYKQKLIFKEERDYRRYDFYSPKKFTKDKIRLLKTIYDNYARIISSQMNSLFRTNTTVEVLSIEEQRYYEFCNALNDNDVFSRVDVTLKEHTKNLPILLHITTGLMLTMIDRMLGGHSTEHTENLQHYTYTEIEISLYRHIVTYLVQPMVTAWKAYIDDINFEFRRVEENSTMLHGVGVDETVIILVLGVEMGTAKEKMNICIPGNLLMDLFDTLEQMQYFTLDDEEERKSNKEEIMDNLRDSLLEVSAQLGVVELSMDDVYNLHVGDVIDLGKPKDSRVGLLIEGEPWFLGKMGSYHKNMAVLIEKMIGKDEIELELESIQSGAEEPKFIEPESIDSELVESKPIQAESIESNSIQVDE